MGEKRSPLSHQHAMGMSLPFSLSLEPKRGKVQRGSKGEGRLTAGSQGGLEQCPGERRAAPRKAGRGKWCPRLTGEIRLK